MLLARREVKADWVAQDGKLLRDEQLRQGRVLTKQEVTLAWHHGDLNNVLVRLARIEVRSFPDNCRWGGGGGQALMPGWDWHPRSPAFQRFIHACIQALMEAWMHPRPQSVQQQPPASRRRQRRSRRIP